MATPPCERQAEHRKKLKTKGKTRFTVTLYSRTAATIRSLAEQHNQTQAEVIRVGIMLAARALQSDIGGE